MSLRACCLRAVRVSPAILANIYGPLGTEKSLGQNVARGAANNHANPVRVLPGQFVPLSEAKIGVMTHAFNYGTAVFEGIRGNWNEDDQTTYLFRQREHFERLAESSKILGLQMHDSVDKLCEMAHEIVECSGYTEDIYLRPMVYLSSEVLGVRLHNLDSDTLIFLTPFPA